jgi:hypothetical protein
LLVFERSASPRALLVVQREVSRDLPEQPASTAGQTSKSGFVATTSTPN